MPKQSQKWKAAERKVANRLTEVTGQTWTRKTRGDNFAISDTDVEPPTQLEHWKLDAKKYKAFAQHTLMQEIIDKYCKNPDDEPILFTEETLDNPRNKAGQPLQMYVTLRLELFAAMTKAYLNQLEQ